MDVLVSVILPVYNVELYIERCLSSIVKQSYKNIEVIILIDGSSDSSESIVDDFILMDKRLKKIRHQNMGLGPTRNVGLKEALGEYIIFIDSDDYIEHDMVETLLENVISEKSDIACSEIYLQKSNERKIRKQFNLVEDCVISNNNIKEFMAKYYYSNIYSHNAVDKMYKKEFLVKNRILFGDNSIIFAEDTFFQIGVISNFPKVSFVSKPLYNYVIRESSLMTSYKDKLVERNINLMNSMRTMFESKGINLSLLDVELFNAIIVELYNVLENNKKFVDFRNSMKKLRNWQKYPTIIKSMLENKSIEMIQSKGKRIFLKFILFLYRNRLDFLGDYFFYMTYYINYKSTRIKK
ncbi:glycosyltransferase family 2 protein [Enterococcus sp. MJM12]|uniref:Glycosyltransferase family 2 protein n=1 Tax=Candidatus Enterococcus myersii TaxID=2815322 RepID=A0ABS3H5K1_9ENTE|nr:glycosyltransferase family 2 protein [Enterococcus sp. MJM12]MBO0448185.1 glycosyltransferase family 2 protein [Enterococcus sp. MJM12]